MTARSYLFVPGTDDRLVPKALGSNADVVVIDLEDAMVPGARAVASDLLRSHRAAITERPTHVRIGWDADGYCLEDVSLAAELGVTTLRLPKAEQPEQLRRVIEASDGRSTRIHATIESAAGLARIAEMSASSSELERLVFGERDFMADLGIDEPGPLTDHARAQVALQSRVAGLLPPIDGADIRIDDPGALRSAAERARALGFWGKSAIHPDQIPVIHEVFSHTSEQVAWAERVRESLDQARNEGRAVTVVDGMLVDAAVARRAEEILRGRSD